MSHAAARESRGQLLHILGVSFGIAVAIGGMIGVGILRTPSLIAAAVPNGELILGLWILGAAQSALEANVISELATSLPQAGGFYVYAHRAFGDIGGLMVGWTAWIGRLASSAALSVAFADFLALIWPVAGRHLSLTSVAMLIAIFGFNMIGLRQGRTLQQVTSLAKTLALGAFCVVAFLTAAPSPAPAAIVPAVGWFGVLAAYQFIIGAYAGWYEPASFSEENTQPGRSLPRAMFLGLIVAAALYVAVNAALIHALGVTQLAKGALPYATILSRAAGPATGTLFAVGALFVVASCANAGIMSAPRILLALSRNQLLPAVFRNVNKGGSPYVAYAMTGLCAIALALSGSFVLLFGLIATLQSAGLVLTLASVFVLRRREPDLPRPYRAVGYPLLPALALAIDIVATVVFLSLNWVGGVYAAIMWLACIPFAWVARRARSQANAR
jgi:APA family basic amino acid/polyamine antiporter